MGCTTYAICWDANAGKGPGPGPLVSLQARAGAMPKVSSFGSLPRSLSDQSMRKRSQDLDHPAPQQPFTSQLDKAESIASTAVRTADKINVSKLMLPAAVCSSVIAAVPHGLVWYVQQCESSSVLCFTVNSNCPCLLLLAPLLQSSRCITCCLMYCGCCLEVLITWVQH